MALPTASPQRLLKHRRQIDVQVYACGNGRWEVDAHIEDTKTRDVTLAGEVRQAGQPIHGMCLRLIIDEQLNVLAAGAETTWMPYPGLCDQYGNAYDRLIGLNLLKNFKQEVKERLGGTQGCTHITELTQVIPTAVIQAFAGEVTPMRATEGDRHPPFQINRCHALREDAPAVQLHYPQWFRPKPEPSY